MKIVFATANPHKLQEVNAICKNAEVEFILPQKDFNPVEDGNTFEENSLIKANAVKGFCKKNNINKIIVADDSGLMVDVLGGEPGVYSARYAVDHAGDELGDHANNEKLLGKLKDYKPEEKTSRFVSAIACVFPDGREIVCEGKCEGMILTDYRGDGGFGYDPLFYVPSIGKTFAEMTQEEKNSVSHRANAMKLFAKEFIKAINEN